MANRLKLAPKLFLPHETVTQTFVILGKRGSGKSNTGVVMFEELVRAGLPAVVVDPMDNWWGAVSSFDGKQAGLEVVIFGGHKADVPLEDTSGKFIADLLMKEGMSAILSVKHLSQSGIKRFVTEFALQLYRKNQDPLHLILEEAELFAPQTVRAEDAKMVAAISHIALRGRSSGLGVTAIVQRTAKVNKDLPTQLEVLIAHRCTGATDIKAVKLWTDAHGTDEQKAALLGSIAKLKDGEAWVWSPAWLDLFGRYQIRRRSTFDSAATPKPGQRRRQPTKRSDLDLGALRDSMADTIKRHQDNDPAELKKVVAALKRDITKLEKQRDGQVPVADKESISRAVTVAEAKSNLHWRGQIATLHRAHDNLAASLAKIHQESASNGEAVPQISEPPASPVVLNPPLRSKSVIRREDVQRATQSTQATYDGEPLHKKYQKLLDSLASLEAMGVLAPERAVVAAVAGVSPKSSAFDGNVRCLKAEELLSYPNAGVLAITDAGRERARATDRLLTTDDLHEAWRRCPALKPAHVKLLDVLIARYPREIGRQDLADAAEVSVASSAFDGNIRLLKKIGLVEYPSHGLVLADKKLLFPEEL